MLFAYEIIGQRIMKKWLWILVAVIIVGGGVFLYFRSPSLSFVNRLANTAAVTPSTLAGGTPYIGAPLTKEYKNDTYRFSLSIPDDFSAQELPADDTGARPHRQKPSATSAKPSSLTA